MNHTQAKLLVLIGSLDPRSRNVHFLTAKLDKSFSAIYNYLKIMECGGSIRRIKTSFGSIFEISDEEEYYKAIKYLQEHDKIKQKMEET